ncbi:MAG TPA: DUF4352 domain-containing protein [Abditibacteriaceae bacterium]|jgi:hypothetical protein
MKLIATLCPILLASTVFAAGTTKTAAKTTTKPPTKTPAKAPQKQPIKGAVQMAGDNGQLGVTYTIGDNGPLNFTLNSAEYRASRVIMGEATIAPTAEQKLLVLNVTLHNPNKDLTALDWGTLRLTAVDPNDQNHEYETYVAKPGTNETLSVELKPAQEIDVFYVIRVPIKGVIPKLIVTPQNGGKVLRYDLRKVVKGLPAPFADTTEPSGANGLAEIKAEAGTFYPLEGFDIKLVSTAYHEGKLGEYEPDEDKRYLIATVTIKNAGAIETAYDNGTFTAALIAEDDEKSDSQNFLKPVRNEGATGNLKPGQEYTGRFFFMLPKDVKAKTLTVAENESRTYSFDVSNTK